jgi:hypothetical protein
MRCLGCCGLWSTDCCMPQRVRMFLDGLARSGSAVLEHSQEWAISPIPRDLCSRDSRWAYRSTVDVDYPGFGAVMIDGERFDHDVVVEAGRVRRRRKRPSKPYRSRYGHTPLSLATRRSSGRRRNPWSGPGQAGGSHPARSMGSRPGPERGTDRPLHVPGMRAAALPR